MKSIVKIFLSICIVLFFCTCEKENIKTPKAEITVNQNRFSINESMVINFTGVADQVVIYTGDEMHNYELRNESNTGFVVNKGLFTYSYSLPGTYKVVCVASTYSDLAKDILRDTCSYAITVIDDVTEIDKISCPQIIYDEVFAERISDSEWLMKLPRKIKYNQATPTIPLSQRLNFYIHSDSTQVYLDGVKYLYTNKYDLSKTIDIKTRSNFGSERIFKLFTIYYPEFSSFKLKGVEGTLVRNAFDYSTFDLEIKLPAGSDIGNIIPEFTTIPTTAKVYYNNAEVVSGVTAVNLSENPKFKIKDVSPANSAITAETTVNIIITYQ